MISGPEGGHICGSSFKGKKRFAFSKVLRWFSMPKSVKNKTTFLIYVRNPLYLFSRKHIEPHCFTLNHRNKTHLKKKPDTVESRYFSRTLHTGQFASAIFVINNKQKTTVLLKIITYVYLSIIKSIGALTDTYKQAEHLKIHSRQISSGFTETTKLWIKFWATTLSPSPQIILAVAIACSSPSTTILQIP